MLTCQFCKNQNIEEVLYLGSLPPVNDMPKIDSSVHITRTYPLCLYFCLECGLTQIGTTLDKEIIFPYSYPYLSGVTRSLVDNFRVQANQAKSLLDLNKNDLVVDIGSNDGSLLKQYARYCQTLGVEPTKAADKAIRDGVNTINDYFTSVTVDKIVATHGKARVVTACNVFAHIDGLHDLMGNVSKVLQDDGVFVSESHYLLSLIQTLQFDTIYHEHLRYYSVTFLQKLFAKFGFRIFNVDRIESHGGSIRVWASRSNSYQESPSVKHQLEEEKKASVTTIDGLLEFASSIVSWRHSFRSIIASLKNQGAKISGIGAPSRASTLIAFAGLTELDLDAVGEVQDSSKIDHFMPGTRIPVLPESEVLRSNPTHLLILSWHIKDGIMPSLRSKGFKGKFIIPLPNPQIIEE